MNALTVMTGGSQTTAGVGADAFKHASIGHEKPEYLQLSAFHTLMQGIPYDRSVFLNSDGSLKSDNIIELKADSLQRVGIIIPVEFHKDITLAKISLAVNDNYLIVEDMDVHNDFSNIGLQATLASNIFQMAKEMGLQGVKGIAEGVNTMAGQDTREVTQLEFWSHFMNFAEETREYGSGGRWGTPDRAALGLDGVTLYFNNFRSYIRKAIELEECEPEILDRFEDIVLGYRTNLDWYAELGQLLRELPEDNNALGLFRYFAGNMVCEFDNQAHVARAERFFDDNKRKARPGNGYLQALDSFIKTQKTQQESTPVLIA